MSLLTLDIGQLLTSKKLVTRTSWALVVCYTLLTIGTLASFASAVLKDHSIGAIGAITIFAPLLLFWSFVIRSCFTLTHYYNRSRWDLLFHALALVALGLMFCFKQNEKTAVLLLLFFLLFSLLGGIFSVSRKIDYKKSLPANTVKEKSFLFPSLLKCFLTGVACVYVLILTRAQVTLKLVLWDLSFVLLFLCALLLAYFIIFKNKNRGRNYIILSVLALLPYILIMLMDPSGWLMFFLLIITGLFWFIAGILDIGLIAWGSIAKTKELQPKIKEMLTSPASPVVPEEPVLEKPLTVHQITPLFQAAIDGDENAVRAALADNQEQINAQFAANGNTVLHVAVWNGHAHIVRLLLRYPGIDIQIQNKNGKTALDLAVEKDFTEIIELLKFAKQK